MNNYNNRYEQLKLEYENLKNQLKQEKNELKRQQLEQAELERVQGILLEASQWDIQDYKETQSLKIAGAFFVIGGLSFYYGNPEYLMKMAEKLDVVHSWQGLAEYIKLLGPGITVGTVGMTGFLGKAIYHRGKMTDLGYKLDCMELAKEEVESNKRKIK